MQDEKLIYRIEHGSRMYGTSTPSSDTDFKEVYVPSGRSILLGRVKEGRAYGPDKDNSEKNKPGDIDTNSFAITKLFKMLSGGDIIGCELIFTPERSILYKHPWYSEILENKRIFLSRKVDGYVGYCRQQANKYGIRGSRVAAVRGMIELIELLMETGHTKIDTAWPALAEYCDQTEHCEVELVPNGNTGQIIPHLVVCGKKQPRTNPMKAALDCYRLIFENYGHRALAAERNEGIDWKAISHACRVGEQAIELLETHRITFPRPNAERLLQIKRGEVAYQEVADYLDELLIHVEAGSKASTLPEKADQAAIDELILSLHSRMV